MLLETETLAADLPAAQHFKAKLIRLPVGGVCAQGFGLSEPPLSQFVLRLTLWSHPVSLYSEYRFTGTMQDLFK